MSQPTDPTTLTEILDFCRGKGANFETHPRNSYARGYGAACNALVGEGAFQAMLH